jgi:hypothetical protein
MNAGARRGTLTTIAQRPDTCRAEASSMPKGPAVGRVEAQRRQNPLDFQDRRTPVNGEPMTDLIQLIVRWSGNGIDYRSGSRGSPPRIRCE